MCRFPFNAVRVFDARPCASSRGSSCHCVRLKIVNCAVNVPPSVRFLCNIAVFGVEVVAAAAAGVVYK